MRLIHAVTASDLQNSGHRYDIVKASWNRIAKLPMFIWIQIGNAVFADPEGVRTTGSSGFLSLQVGRAAASWQADEVIGCGHYMATTAGKVLPTNGASYLRVASSVGEENLFTWTEVVAGALGELGMFVEYVGSYDLKTWSLYVNGKFIKSVQSALNHDRTTLNFYFMSAPATGAITTLIVKDVYAAFFKPATEKVYLGGWACEALVVGASQFPSSDSDNNIDDTLSVTPKTIEFNYSGTRKLSSVMLGGTVDGAFPERLDAKLSSGSSERTTSMLDTPLVGVADNWVGRGIDVANHLGSVDFDNVSKKVTASLKLLP
jgi:hypothetical protein